MSQKFEMELNSLPAKTWNWLHMNGTTRSEQLLGQTGDPQEEIPESVTVVSWSEKGYEEESGKLALLETGIGAQFSEFLRQGTTTGQLFVTSQGMKEEQPLRLTFPYEDGSHVQNQIGLYLRRNSELTLIMDFTSAKEAGGVAAAQLRVWAEPHTVLHLIQLQRLGKGYTFYNDIGAACEENSQVNVIQLVLGGSQTYLGSRAMLSGTASAWNSDVGYLVGGAGLLDMNFVAYHTGKKTMSRMDASGVLREQGRKLFRGTIDFRKGAVGAVGNEKEDVLLLDDTVMNQTIPLILCEEEDVEGNHGATIGKLDEELLFYLESRGIPKTEVYEMMGKARIDAIISRIEDERTRKLVAEYLYPKRSEE